MTTINISIPTRLKSQAEVLVENGFYVSFSDLVRDSLRRLIEKTKYDLWIDGAKQDLKKGRAVVLDSEGKIESYLKTL